MNYLIQIPLFNLIHDVQSNFIFSFSLIAFANQLIQVILNLNSALFLLRSNNDLQYTEK